MGVRALMAYRFANNSPDSGAHDMDHHNAGKIPRSRHFLSLLLTSILSLLLSLPLLAEDETKHQKDTFPDTAALLAAVIQRERAADLEVQSLVFKDNVIVSALDAAGQLRAPRTETRYFNASEYNPFALHIETNGKSLNIPFFEILGRSRLVPLEWSDLQGTRVIAFSFEAQSPVAKHGDLESRIAGDLRGTVWVSPEDTSIVRFEFQTVLPIALGKGFLGRIDYLKGFLQLQQGAGDLWLPARQEFVTQGKNTVGFVVGVRISKRFRTQQTDELDRYAPVFDMVRAKPSPLRYGD
jgi:hypothetical protein